MCRNNWRQGVREIDELWDIGNTQARDDEVLTEGCGSEEEEERHVSDAEEVGSDNQLIIIWVIITWFRCAGEKFDVCVWDLLWSEVGSRPYGLLLALSGRPLLACSY